MSATDRSYTLLLNHLHNANTSLPLPTLQGALAHHLATSSPSPTPLAATAITSPFYLAQPLTYRKLHSLSTAFRHATHLKYRALRDADKKRSSLGGLFKQSLLSAMDEWVKEVVKGLQGGHPVLKLASCTGLLLGVEDIRHTTKEESGEGGLEIRSARGAVEDEDILALAEVMDAYAFTVSGSGSSCGVEEWEKEFQPAGQDILSLALIFASQSFPLISQHKLRVLPLPILAHILKATLSATFKSGTFLSSVSASVSLTPEHHVHISPSSAFAQTIQSITSSPLTASISSLSRFTANVLALLLDTSSSSLDGNMRAVSDTLEALRDVAKAVERDWISTSLASVTENEIADDTKELTKSVWTILKTLLFTIIMVSDAALSAVIFVPPTSLPSGITASSLALQTLHTLSHLSFVISQFGGVTSTSQGFEVLKKTFYLALDILAQGDGAHGDAGVKAEAYVEQSCIALNSHRTEGNIAFRQAKEAYILASIEQLVPVLSDKCVRNWVWGVCYPHLSDASHRETFESAHSVVLAIFASHAQQQQQAASPRRTVERSESASPWLNRVRRWTRPTGQRLRDRVMGGGGIDDADSGVANTEKPEYATRSISTEFVTRMVPFYARCLIENSVEGRLSTAQLRLAYSALVRSACARALTYEDAPEETYALAWYCVQLILDVLHNRVIRDRGDGKGKGKGKAVEAQRDADGGERGHRLTLTLISTVSSLPLSLMSRALSEILSILVAYPRGQVGGDAAEWQSEGRKKELVEALFREILEGVGDREKKFAMSWWYEHMAELTSSVAEAGERAVVSLPLQEERRDDSSAQKGELDELSLSRL